MMHFYILFHDFNSQFLFCYWRIYHAPFRCTAWAYKHFYKLRVWVQTGAIRDPFLISCHSLMFHLLHYTDSLWWLNKYSSRNMYNLFYITQCLTFNRCLTAHVDIILYSIFNYKNIPDTIHTPKSGLQLHLWKQFIGITVIECLALHRYIVVCLLIHGEYSSLNCGLSHFCALPILTCVRC